MTPIVADACSSPVLELVRSSASRLVFDGGLELDASELAARGTDLGAGLLQLCKPGDRVALWMANGVDYVQSFLACASAGLVAVSVNTRYSVTEVEMLFARSGATVVITDQDWVGDGVRVIRCSELAGITDESSGVCLGGSEDRCVVFTTSGTTSQPKMVVHQQSSIADHARDVGALALWAVDDVALVSMPLCGTFGLASLLAVVAAGCRRVLVPSVFEVESTSRLIESEQVSVANGSDDMFHRLLGTEADLSSIRVGGYARFNTSLDGIVERADARGMTLVGLYGMSEVQALFTFRDPAASPIDRTLAGGSMSSLSAEARVVADELQLRGASLFEGYLAEGGESIDAELMEQAMDGDWFLTGDSAEMVAGPRQFTFLGRLGDVLRIGGFLVAPTEIEQVLMTYPGIAAAQAVALDRPTGARPVAFVVLDDEGSLDEAAVKAHCAEELAKFKIPIRILVLDSFPMLDGPNGKKVRRTELRDLAASLVD